MVKGSIELAIAELTELNKKADVLIGLLGKPENRVEKLLETTGAVVTVMSILSIIDILRHWFGF